MTHFSSPESVSLEKEIDQTVLPVQTKLEDLENTYEIQKCCQWIFENDFKNICLQFPDHLLPDSREIAKRLKNSVSRNIYILADTAYGSCCIDYAAAEHVKADAIIHFGPTCISKTSTFIPYLNIYEKSNLSLSDLINCFNKQFLNTENVIILIDTCYVYLVDELTASFNCLIYSLDKEDLNLTDSVTLFICQDLRKIVNVKCSLKPKQLFYYNPNNKSEIKDYEIDSKILKRHNYLIEKIKDANTLGIIICTLGVKNYLKVIDRLKQLIKLHGKKYYTISVGKPTVAKLANFPEIDVYTLVGCAMNEIYECRDYYKPIVTPYDVEAALNPCHCNDLSFTYDYNTFLTPSIDLDLEKLKLMVKETDVSLVTGRMRGVKDESDISGDSKEVALKSNGVLMLNSNCGAGFLVQRSWQGLEQKLGQDEPKIAEDGRKGLARNYDSEIS